jgi:transcriptional regulator with XRE-family HTH domain
MPRRAKPTRFALAIGRRLRALREGKGLTLARVGESGEDRGNLKGHLSNVEHGRVNITVQTLQKVAAHIGLELPYLVTLPSESTRQALIERTRFLADEEIEQLLTRLGPAPPAPTPQPRRRVRHRASGKGRKRI